MNFKGAELNCCGTSDENAQYGTYKYCIHESYTEIQILEMVHGYELDNSEERQENAKVLAKIGVLREWAAVMKG